MGSKENSELFELTAQHTENILSLQGVNLASPWSLDSIKNTLENEYNFSHGVMLNGELVSFCLSTLVIDELNILHFVTHKDYRRLGLGKFLLFELIKKAKARGCVSSFLEVRKSNFPAIALYQSLGFSEVDIRVNYYQDPSEDASTMKLSLYE